MQVKQKQVIYHDWESGRYDEKWAIGFDERCIDYAVGRLRRAVPEVRRYDRVLDVGCGTGFFLLNLAQTGIIGAGHCTDISSGMVRTCMANARRLGIEVRGLVADAEALPYPDGTFDLVLGHAVAHHLPSPRTFFKEAVRVLCPGGRMVLAGEPTRTGDRIAAQFKRAARVGVKLAAVAGGSRRVLRPGAEALPPEGQQAARLEWEVDLHCFTPAELEGLARDAGFTGVTTYTEELTANWFGWTTRTVETMVRPDLLPARYPWWAYRVWRRLFTFDDLARRALPKGVFYNCILTGVAPRQGTSVPDRP